jgi:hypothetical protein
MICHGARDARFLSFHYITHITLHYITYITLYYIYCITLPPAPLEGGLALPLGVRLEHRSREDGSAALPAAVPHCAALPAAASRAAAAIDSAAADAASSADDGRGGRLGSGRGRGHLVEGAKIVVLGVALGGLADATRGSQPATRRCSGVHRGDPRLQVGRGGRGGGALIEVWRHFKPARRSLTVDPSARV